MANTFWDNRYGEEGDFAYGILPNDYLNEAVSTIISDNIKLDNTCNNELKEYLIKNNINIMKDLSNPKALCICDGEGRNSIFLSKLGFDVTAMDISKIGMEKLNKWSKKESLNICTIIADLNDFDFGYEKWDLIVSIFAHTPPFIRIKVHNNLHNSLKKNGLFILEAYTPLNIGRGTGGPPVGSELMCMTKNSLLEEIKSLTFIQIEEKERICVEGKYHQIGIDNQISSVVQVIAIKE